MPDAGPPSSCLPCRRRRCSLMPHFSAVCSGSAEIFGRFWNVWRGRRQHSGARRAWRHIMPYGTCLTGIHIMTRAGAACWWRNILAYTPLSGNRFSSSAGRRQKRGTFPCRRVICWQAMNSSGCSASMKTTSPFVSSRFFFNNFLRSAII